MAVRAILFDLDGTLVDLERESAEAMARAMRSGLGIEITQVDRDYNVGRSWVDIYQHLDGAYGPLAWSREQLIAATTRHRVDVFAEVGVTVLPGAREVIARFRDLPLAVVTGSSRAEARQSLDALGVWDAFGAVIASEDVGRSKPAPDGYLAAARLLGIDPAECLVVEDSHPGIAAGLAAGSRVIAVEAGNFAGHDQSAAHHILPTLEGLTREFLARLSW